MGCVTHFASAPYHRLDQRRRLVLAAASWRCHHAGWPHVQALNELDFPERLQRLLLAPQRIVCSELVITLDSGEIAAFNAWRVQHDNSRGPFKGGFRFHPAADLDDARRWPSAPHPGAPNAFLTKMLVAQRSDIGRGAVPP